MGYLKAMSARSFFLEGYPLRSVVTLKPIGGLTLGTYALEVPSVNAPINSGKASFFLLFLRIVFILDFTQGLLPLRFFHRSTRVTRGNGREI